jgi:hypothetical protein
MATEDHGYLMQKVGEARRALMAPHRHGEAEDFAGAMNACAIGLGHIRARHKLDEDLERSLRVVDCTLDTSGLEDTHQVGMYLIKARTLSYEERSAFASAIDELASWASREFWSRGRA